MDVPADKVANDICMTNKNFKAIFLLSVLSSVEIFAKSSLNSSPISVKLL